MGYVVRGRYPGVVPVMVASPLVHALHGNASMTVASVLTRASLYSLTYALGRYEEHLCEGKFLCVPVGTLLALATVGALTTTIDVFNAYTDDAVAGWKKLPVIPSVQTNGKDLTLSASWIF